jgi:hypothetical protein
VPYSQSSGVGVRSHIALLILKRCLTVSGGAFVALVFLSLTASPSSLSNVVGSGESAVTKVTETATQPLSPSLPPVNPPLPEPVPTPPTATAPSPPVSQVPEKTLPEATSPAAPSPTPSHSAPQVDRTGGHRPLPPVPSAPAAKLSSHEPGVSAVEEGVRPVGRSVGTVRDTVPKNGKQASAGSSDLGAAARESTSQTGTPFNRALASGAALLEPALRALGLGGDATAFMQMVQKRILEANSIATVFFSAASPIVALRRMTKIHPSIAPARRAALRRWFIRVWPAVEVWRARQGYEARGEQPLGAPVLTGVADFARSLLLATGFNMAIGDSQPVADQSPSNSGPSIPSIVPGPAAISMLALVLIAAAMVLLAPTAWEGFRRSWYR